MLTHARLLILAAGPTIALAGVVAFDLIARGVHESTATPTWQFDDADVRRAPMLIERYGCGACHTIRGVRTATGRVGPQLLDLRSQIYLAGVLENRPENLVAWIRRPQAIQPGSAMPNLDVTEADARDIAAYLYANP